MKNTTPIQDVNFKNSHSLHWCPNKRRVDALIFFFCFKCYYTKSLILILFNSAKKQNVLLMCNTVT